MHANLLPGQFARFAVILHNPFCPFFDLNARREGENPNLQNELLERKDGERLDTGTMGTAGK
jgi:hypothetical protein